MKKNLTKKSFVDYYILFKKELQWKALFSLSFFGESFTLERIFVLS